MKILQVSHSFYPCYQAGGVVKVVYDISKELVNKNHTVTVYTTDGCNSRLEVETDIPVIIDGIRVYYFKNISNWLRIKLKIATPLALVGVLKKEIRDFDIIHIHEHRTLLAAIVTHYARKNNVPYIVQSHGSVLPFFQKQLLKKIFDTLLGERILQQASKIIAVSNNEKKQYLQIKIPGKIIEIVPNGIDISVFDTLPERGYFRNHHGITPDEQVVLYLGRLHQRKGIDFLINGFSIVSTKYSDIKLVIAGPDDGFYNSLRTQSKDLSIDDKTIFTGFLSEIEKIQALVDADILVYPGIHEIFGLVPFEAIMCGTPVIVCDDSGCGEVINEAHCGYLVKYGDTVELKDRIEALLCNPDKARAMVRQGRAYISNNLQWNNIGINLEKIYEDCINHV